MKKPYLIIRTILLWIISGIHFFTICTFLVILGIFVDPRKNDRPQRWFFRNILRLAGAGFKVIQSPGFDRERTSFFVCNHIDIFDAFVIYSAIPQFVRGFELESHFKVPAYGWMMKRFGNIPIKKNATPAEYRELMRRTKQALDSGVSIMVFPEGTRTLDGRVGQFQDGVFRMAIQFGYPIVPMSAVGSYEFSHKGDWMLYPSDITVYMHDTIDTRGLSKNDVESLKARVHAIVSGPVNDSRREAGKPGHAVDVSQEALGPRS
ncbi:MAG TPA: lysophospholipid acyltransferase family protein [Blastocatellia bacterium]|nr:lysophospholipid acyltransferase family protein [Blastocatellia bacterium]